MTNKEKDRKDFNPLAAGIAAIIGAGAGVAATKALENPKARSKVKRTLKDVKEKASDYGSQIKRGKTRALRKVRTTASTIKRKTKNN